MIALAVGYIIYSSYASRETMALMTKRLMKPRYVASIYGKGKYRLVEPMDVAVGPDKKIYVADAGNSRIVVFNQKGVAIKVFGNNGGNRLYYPTRLTIDAEGRVYVVDPSSGKVFIFSSSGRFLRYMPRNGWEIPGAIALARNGEIYLTDLKKQKLMELNSDASIKNELGREQLPADFVDMPLQDGRFLFPGGLAIGKKNRVWIADSNNARIQIYDAKLGFTSITQATSRTGSKFYLPRDIAIDNDGKVYVADAMAHKIFVFNQNTEPDLSFGEAGFMEGKLFMPNGVGIGPDDDRVYIAEKGAHRISVWATPKVGRLVAFNSGLKPAVPLALITLVAISASLLRRRGGKSSRRSLIKQLKRSRVENGARVCHRVDLSLCSECESCTAACRSINGEPRLNRKRGELVAFNTWRSFACTQCTERYCIAACSLKAVTVAGDGVTVTISEECSGCGVCVKACPYNAITVLNVDNVEPITAEIIKKHFTNKKAVKCDLCYGQKHLACVHNCPTGAISVIIAGAKEPAAFPASAKATIAG